MSIELDLPVIVEFVPGTTLLREQDRRSPLPVVGNGPPGTFVCFPEGLRVSLPTDQIVDANDAAGSVRATFYGMQFSGVNRGQLRFDRVRELRAETELSPARSHMMLLDVAWVARVSA